MSKRKNEQKLELKQLKHQRLKKNEICRVRKDKMCNNEKAWIKLMSVDQFYHFKEFVFNNKDDIHWRCNYDSTLNDFNISDLILCSGNEISLKKMVNKYRMRFPLHGPVFNEELENSHLILQLTNEYIKPELRFTYVSTLYYSIYGAVCDIIVCGVISEYEVIKRISEREFTARVYYHEATRMLSADGRTNRYENYCSKQCEMNSIHTFIYLDTQSYWTLSSKNREIFPPHNHLNFNYNKCNKLHHRGYIDWTQVINRIPYYTKYRFTLREGLGLRLNIDEGLQNPDFTKQMDYLRVKNQFELLNQYACDEIHSLFHIPDIYLIIAAY